MSVSIGGVSVMIGVDARGFNAGLAGAAQALASFGVGSQGAMEGLTGLSGSLGLLSGGGGLLSTILGALTAGAVSAVSAFAEFEYAQTGMEVITGSAEDAADMMKFLQDTAVKTPYSFADMRKVASMMLGVGFGTEQIKEMMPQLADLGAVAGMVTGNASEGIERVVRAMSQMKAKGKVYSEEMGKQLGEAGIPAWKALSRELGFGEGEEGIAKAQAKVKAGQVNATTGIRALLNLAKSDYPGLSERASHTLKGNWSNIGDYAERFQMAVGEALNKAFDINGILTGVGGFLMQLAEDVKAPLAAVGDFIQGPLKGALVELGAEAGGLFRDLFGDSDFMPVALAAWEYLKVTIVAGVDVIRSVFQGLREVFASDATPDNTAATSFRDSWVDAILNAAFYMKTWKMQMEIEIGDIALAWVTFRNDFSFFFTNQLPALLQLFSGGWGLVLADLGNNFMAFLRNLGQNIFLLSGSIRRIMLGEITPDDVAWVSFTEGFQNSFRDAWDQATQGRELSDGEKAFMDRQEKMRAALEQDRKNWIDGIKEGIFSVFGGAGAAEEPGFGLMGAIGWLRKKGAKAPGGGEEVHPEDTLRLPEEALAGSKEAAEIMGRFWSESKMVDPLLEVAEEQRDIEQETLEACQEQIAILKELLDVLEADEILGLDLV